MSDRAPPTARPRSVHWWISAALIGFGIVMITALTLQAFSSQRLVEHEIWRDMLQALSTDYAARVRQGDGASLPDIGVIRAWYVEDAGGARQVPDYLADLAPGYYSSEGSHGVFATDESFHALIVALPPGRLITAIDIAELEAQQNRDSVISGLWALVLLALIGGVIAWLHANLVRPVRDLADRMQAMDPATVGVRLPTTYRREEIEVIARASNAHLERVERFIERERSLLDQASHEFRTPIAVISGAVDVLRQLELPPSSAPALNRIGHAVEDLSETMVALLYLAREAGAGNAPADVCVLHELLPRLIRDHEHLVRDKPARLHLRELEPTFIAVPEAMVRIAVSNLLRNAIENTDAGFVELSLSGGVIGVADSGSGFDPVEAARRYRESLRRSTPVRGQGLGLFLIGRIAERFRWKLAIDAAADGGTRATLDVTASVVAPP